MKSIEKKIFDEAKIEILNIVTEDILTVSGGYGDELEPDIFNCSFFQAGNSSK